MAELIVAPPNLVLRLSRREKVLALHRDLRTALSSVRRVSVLEDAHFAADRGFFVGERTRGRYEIGISWSDGRKVFAVVYRNHQRGIEVELNNSEFDAWVIGSLEPESVRRSIDSRLDQVED